ncbi:MAG: hypothetical protein RLN84_01255 [Rhodospirillaceae bacterium]
MTECEHSPEAPPSQNDDAPTEAGAPQVEPPQTPTASAPSSKITKTRMERTSETLDLGIKIGTLLAMCGAAYLAVRYDVQQRETANRIANYQVDGTRIQVEGETETGTFTSDSYRFTYVRPRLTIKGESIAVVDPAGVCWRITFKNFVGKVFADLKSFRPSTGVSAEHAQDGRDYSCSDFPNATDTPSLAPMRINGIDDVSSIVLAFVEFERPGVIEWEARVPIFYEGKWRTYGTGDLIVAKRLDATAQQHAED